MKKLLIFFILLPEILLSQCGSGLNIYSQSDISEGYPFFDEFGFSVLNGKLRMQPVGLREEGSICFSIAHFPYLFPFGQCNDKPNDRLYLTYSYGKWVKRERKPWTTKMHILNGLGMISDDHPFNGQIDTTYTCGFGNFPRQQLISMYPKWKLRKDSVEIYLNNKINSKKREEVWINNYKLTIQGRFKRFGSNTIYPSGLSIKRHVGNKFLGELMILVNEYPWQSATLVDALKTADNGIIVGFDFIEDHRNPFFKHSFLVFKLDYEGNVLWRRMLNSGSSNRLTCMKLLSNGSVLLGGNQMGIFRFDERSSGQASGWNISVFKLSSGGDVIWKKLYAGSGDDKIYDILFNDENRIYLVGTSTSQQTYKPPSNYPSVTRIESNLGFKCERPLNMLMAIVIDENGNQTGYNIINSDVIGHTRKLQNQTPLSAYNVFSYGSVELNSNNEFEYQYGRLRILWTQSGSGRSKPPFTGETFINDVINWEVVGGKKNAMINDGLRLNFQPIPPTIRNK